MRRMMLLALLTACSSLESAAINTKFDRDPCTTASECGTGFICLNNACVTNETIGPEQVHVEIDAGAGVPYVRTQFLDSVAIGGMLNLQFPTPAEFEVSVLRDATPIPATISVFGSPRIPDREKDITQDLNSSASILRLLPGSYSVRLTPRDSALPGFEASDFVVRNSDTRQAKTFEVPSPYRTLDGVVVSGISQNSTIEDVVVRAVGQRSGLPSTEAITGTDGVYSVSLPNTTESQFVLTARLANPTGPSWYFEQLIKVEGSNRIKQIELEPTDPALRGTVKLKVLGEGAGVPNATVVLSATTTVELDTRMYRAEGLTDADGFVELPILAGHYLVEVKTSQRSMFASRTDMIDFSDARGITYDAQVVLERRTEVIGIVRSASQIPVRGALVDLIALGRDGHTFDTDTQSDGSFAALVDPGTYLVVIRPESQGELLPVHAVEVTVEPSERFDLPLITLPVGTQVTGTVRGESADTIGGARVEFFVRQSDRTISIARTITNPSGYYSVVLPNPR
jgi:hypothetical protein